MSGKPRVCVLSLVSGVLTYGGGDIIAQLHSSDSYSWKNTAVICTLGGITTTAILPWWFRTLDHVFGKSMLDKRIVIAKMLSDQAFYAPFSVSLFVFTQAELCKVPAAQAMSRQELIHLWLADCLIWPFINWVNFRYVPLGFRPPYVACCQLLWQAFMSLACQTNLSLLSPLKSPTILPSPLSGKTGDMTVLHSE